jgi:carnitine O-acetyltransferase
LSEKKKLFADAIKSQQNYMRQASEGRGVDRHLLGLRCMMQGKDAEKATLFNDPAYLKSMWFRLSTSNMSPGKYFYGGFGPVVPDGYGINYAIDKDALKLSISSKISCKETNSYRFRETLLRTLKDMTLLFPKRYSYSS